ncbi:hypothetical protein [Streptomyces luteocolor]|uniref:hypothetical protein n=1 Tax=Streptomyces luteocolor TaxID=285500 RepID=UPI000A9A3DA7|nr:hypothetical protein [Streptomyces luteocolor]
MRERERKSAGEVLRGWVRHTWLLFGRYVLRGAATALGAALAGWGVWWAGGR